MTYKLKPTGAGYKELPTTAVAMAFEIRVARLTDEEFACYLELCVEDVHEGRCPKNKEDFANIMKESARRLRLKS